MDNEIQSYDSGHVMDLSGRDVNVRTFLAGLEREGLLKDGMTATDVIRFLEGDEKVVPVSGVVGDLSERRRAALADIYECATDKGDPRELLDAIRERAQHPALRDHDSRLNSNPKGGNV